MNEDDVDEYLHYISRSSTEYYLSGRYKSELYLTQNKLSDSESDEEHRPGPSFQATSKPLPPAILELPPHVIESRIEEFLSKFKQSGMGIFAGEALNFDRDDEGVKDVESLKSKPRCRRKPRQARSVVLVKHKDKTLTWASDHLNFRDSVGQGEENPTRGDVHSRASEKTDVTEENCFDSSNFRASWVSNESSTPSCPRQSITSPSDNNFLSSSLTSSGMSQLGDELSDDRWSFDFRVDNFDYPDRQARSDLDESGRGPSISSSCSRKFSGSSASVPIFRILPRGSARPSIVSSGRAMGESNCMLTILDVANVLQKNFAFISGGTSRRDFILVSFPECPLNSTISDDHFKSITFYLASILSPPEQETGVVVVVDRRQDKWASVKTLLIQITNFFPTPVHKIYVLRPLSFLQKTFADTGLKFIKEEFRVKVLILDSIEILHDYIDKDQLTSEFGGGLAFNLSEWIQHRAALEKFSANVAVARQNMLSICRDLQEREFPNDVKQTEVLMHDHEAIKTEIEEDVRSTVNHGRVLVECFVGQEAGFGSGPISEGNLKLLPKSKQNHVAAAHRLLSQVEEAAKSFNSFWSLHKVKLEQCLQLRKFEEDFKQLQYTCDKHLKYLESIEVKCGSGVEANDILSNLRKFEETSKSDILQADALKARGEKFIAENHYALDCIRPKCSELDRVVQTYDGLLKLSLDVASKSKELFDSIENADRWCSKGVDFLASQAIEHNHSPEEITKSISDLDLLIGDFKNHGFSSPKEFHQKFNSLLTPEIKTSVENILSRSEDVHGMLAKCRTKLCSQIVVKPISKPVHVVQPERSSKLSPPILINQAVNDNNGNDSGNDGHAFSPFSMSMVNLNGSPSIHVQDSSQSTLQIAIPDELEKTKPKRKFSLKKLGKLERRFSKSTQNLDLIKTRLSPNPEREDDLSLRRRDIMAEIVSAERLYADTLHTVLKNYIKELESPDMLPMIPEELVGRRRELFSNWSEIFSFHSEIFVKELESAESMNSIEAFCFSFIIHKDDLTKLYIDFSKNRMTSTELLNKVMHCNFMKECQRKASTIETLDVLLSKPLQQLQIYHRLLKELPRYCTPEQGLESAKESADIIGKLIEKSSAAMNIIAIEGFEGDLSVGGRLIQQGLFVVQVEGGKSWGFLKNKSGSARHLFLYETFIIICKKLESNGNGNPAYQFKALLPTSELALTESIKGDKKKFQLSLHKTSESYIIQASSISVKDFWVSEIKRILLGQFERIKSDNLNKNSFRYCKRSPSITIRNGFHPLSNSNNNNSGRGLHVNKKSFMSTSMVDLSKIPGQTYVAARNHLATRPDELTLAMGTEVVLVDPGEEGWSFVREANDPKKEGWIPSNLLVERKNHPPLNSLIRDNYTWSHSSESLEQPA